MLKFRAVTDFVANKVGAYRRNDLSSSEEPIVKFGDGAFCWVPDGFGQRQLRREGLWVGRHRILSRVGFAQWTQELEDPS